MNADLETPKAGPSTAWSPARRYYVLAVLCLVGLFNFVDRQIISIMIEPIKKEFGASDTAMGALTGIVFAAFYILAALPLARVADIGARRTLIAGCLAVWSGMTALGGLAQSFTQLALTRVGVAIGEAGAGPASYSMIADLFSVKNRATMISIFIGIQALGIGLGMFLGGWLSQHFTWRMAFAVVGVPGIFLALLIMLTVKEPPRGMSDAVQSDAPKPRFMEAARRLWAMKSYRYVALTYLFASIPPYAVLGWGPTLFMRVYKVEPATVGLLFGTLTAAGLFLSSTLSGWLGDRFSKGDLRFYVRMAAGGCAASVPLMLGFAFAPQAWMCFIFLFVFLFSANLQTPALMSMAQALAPLRMRALAAVVLTILNSLSGVGLAPLMVGALNDAFQPAFGAEAIRYSVALMLFGSIGAAVCGLLAARTIREDGRRTQAEARGA